MFDVCGGRPRTRPIRGRAHVSLVTLWVLREPADLRGPCACRPWGRERTLLKLVADGTMFLPPVDGGLPLQFALSVAATGPSGGVGRNHRKPDNRLIEGQTGAVSCDYPFR